MSKYTDNIECTLKLVYNGKYASFPLYPAFISTEDFPKSFTYDPTYDKLVKQGAQPSDSPATTRNRRDDVY